MMPHVTHSIDSMCVCNHEHPGPNPHSQLRNDLSQLKSAFIIVYETEKSQAQAYPDS
jgi:hypothetical protein